MIVSSKALVQGQRDRINFMKDIIHFKELPLWIWIKELNKKDAIDPYLFQLL